MLLELFDVPENGQDEKLPGPGFSVNGTQGREFTLLVLVKKITLTVFNINTDNRLAIQAMRGAADSGVVGAHRHLYLV